jgi:outer membrane receptor protein involved in Fe transport
MVVHLPENPRIPILRHARRPGKPLKPAEIRPKFDRDELQFLRLLATVPPISDGSFCNSSRSNFPNFPPRAVRGRIGVGMITQLLVLLLIQTGALLDPQMTDLAGTAYAGIEVVTVTPERSATPLATTPVPVTVLTSAALAAAPQRALDEVLRGTPGFSLFRASSSRVANPTAQGLTLRGLGGSGASRALVLLDGSPLNDPFGGWVAWTRIPATLANRVEVARGGASELYGSGALSGVVQVISPDPGRPRLRMLADAGSGPQARVSGTAGHRRRGMALLAAGELARDHGAFVVSEDDRGPVDERAGADHGSLLVRLDAGAPRLRGSLRGAVFDENRRNGTPLQVNDTDLRQAIGSISGTTARGWWQARTAWSTQTYDQHFSSVAPGRAAEVLTRTQRVPAERLSAAAEWHVVAGAATVLAGADASRVDGTTHEVPYVAGRPGATTVAGGRQESLAAFAHLRAGAGRVGVSGGARAERWQVRDQVTGRTRDSGAFVPRASVAWGAAPWHVALSAHAAFRAPTLNELFRGFRVGDTVTRPNPDLLPERSRGLDLTLLAASTRGSVRGTAFWTVLDDPIANVTVSESSALIVRERRNAGRLRSAGVELEGEWRVRPGFRLLSTFAATDAVFAEGPEPGLAGRRVPQVPRYQAGALLYAAPRRGLEVTLDVRRYGERFEDDRNTLPLGPYTTLDVSASQAVHEGVHVFVAVENVLDEPYLTGRTPLPTVGASRSVRAGLRWTLP